MSTADRTLVIETATEACSIALFEGDQLISNEHREIGRGHAETLVPMIADLPGKGRADRILVSLGPGSFTGVRIGIATARALGVAWGATVLGYPTLALVFSAAEQCGPATVCMNGGHGEWFVQNFDVNGSGGELHSISPDAAAAGEVHGTVLGNRAQELIDLVGGNRTAIALLPNASMAHLLKRGVPTTDLTPIYGRAPDAKPQAAA